MERYFSKLFSINIMENKIKHELRALHVSKRTVTCKARSSTAWRFSYMSYMNPVTFWTTALIVLGCHVYIITFRTI